MQSEPTNRHSLPKLIPDAPTQIDSHANTRHNTPQHDTTHTPRHSKRHTFLDQETGENRDALSPCKGAAHHRVYRQVRHHSNQLGQHVVNVGLLLHHRRRRKERGLFMFYVTPVAMTRYRSHRSANRTIPCQSAVTRRRCHGRRILRTKPRQPGSRPHGRLAEKSANRAKHKV